MKNNNLLKSILKKLTCFVLAGFMVLQIVPEGAFEIKASGELGMVQAIQANGYTGEILSFSDIEQLRDYIERYSEDGNRVYIEMSSDWTIDKGLVFEKANFYIYMNGHMINRGLTSNDYFKKNQYQDEANSGNPIDVCDGAKLYIEGGIGAQDHYGTISYLKDGSAVKGVWSYEENGSENRIEGGLITGGWNFSYNQGGAISIWGGSQVILNNVTIAGNVTKTQEGGAIVLYSKNDSLELIDSTIAYNFVDNFKSGGYGGAIYSEGDKNTISITDSKIHNNTATKDGGAIYCEEYKANVTITNSEIYNNYAGRNGGAIGLDDDEMTITLSNSKIHDNYAGKNGGGVYIAKDAYSSTINLTNNSVIDSNTANNGGGIYSESYDITMTSSDLTGSISNNTATNGGGGIYNSNGTYGFYTETQQTKIDGLMISKNTAKGSNGGGGIYNAAVSSASLQDDKGNIKVFINNCTITENTTTNTAGGVYSPDNYGNGIFFNDTTITGNTSSGTAGGVDVYCLAVQGTVIIKDNLLNGTVSNARFRNTIYGNVSSLSTIGLSSANSITEKTEIDYQQSKTYKKPENGQKVTVNYPKEAFFSDDDSLKVVQDTTKDLYLKPYKIPGLKIYVHDPINNKDVDVTNTVYSSNGQYIQLNAYTALGLNPAEYEFTGWGDYIDTEKGGVIYPVPISGNNPDYKMTSIDENLKTITFKPQFTKRITNVAVTMKSKWDFSEVFTAGTNEVKNTEGYSIYYDYHNSAYDFTLNITYKGSTNNGIHFSEATTGTIELAENSGYTAYDDKTTVTYNADKSSITLSRRFLKEGTEATKVDVTVNAYDINDNSTTIGTSTNQIVTDEGTKVGALNIENYQFDHWEDSEGKTLEADNHGLLTVNTNTEQTYRAIYKPIVTKIEAVIPELTVGQSFPTSVTSATYTIGGKTRSDITTGLSFKKLDGENYVDPTGVVEADTTYKAILKPSISNTFKYALSDNITITVTSGSTTDNLTKSDIKTNASAQVGGPTTSKIRSLRVFKEENEETNEPYIECLFKTPEAQDTSYSETYPLDNVSVDRGADYSTIIGKLATQATIKRKNGATEQVTITWDTTTPTGFNASPEDATTYTATGKIAVDNKEYTVTQNFTVPGNPDKLSAPTPDWSTGNSLDTAVSYKGSIYVSLVSTNDNNDIIYYTATNDGSEPENPTTSSNKKVYNYENGVIKIVAPQDDSTKIVRIKTYAAPLDNSGKTASNVVEYVYKVTKDAWYTVKFDFDGGSDSDVGGGVYTMPLIENGDAIYFKDEPTKSGYKFIGWLGSDGNTYQIEDLMKVRSDLTFKALWKSLTPDTSDSTNIPLWAGTTLVSLAIVGLLLKKRLEDQLN